MNWTRVADARAAFEKRWQRGDLLRMALAGEGNTALRMPIRGPTTQALSGQFVDVRAWVDEWRALAHGHVEWAEKRDRVVGVQTLPVALSFAHVDELTGWLGHQRDLATVHALAEATGRRRAAALAWLIRRPFQAIELAHVLPRLLDVADWIEAHPQSGLYARQVDVAGTHSKFIERHLAVLREWLVGAGEEAGIAANLGLRAKPLRLRFRILDPDLVTLPGTICPDIEMDATNVARLALPVDEVFITENEVNFLAFPERPRALVVFGAGYGWSALAQARWLERCRVRYWGDIDTHGFAILDALRLHVPHARSFLMDRQTLMDHADAWTTEETPSQRALGRLSAEESALYDDLRLRRISGPMSARGAAPEDGAQVRLEQERIGYGYLRAALAAVD